MVTSICSVIIYVANIRLPYIAAESCRYIGSATTFLSMFVMGFLFHPFIQNETLFFVTVIMAALPVGSLVLIIV